MTEVILPSLAEADIAFQLLKPIENLHAWIKDREGKFVVANTLFSERFGFANGSQLVGLSDHHLAPDYLAKRYIDDDLQVLQGAVITNRLELIVSRDAGASWFRTSKWPIYNPRGEIIGTYGISKQLRPPRAHSTPIRELNMPIEYIQQNYSENISIAKLADACHVSVSTLERRFKKHLAKTPLQYLMEVRLDNARVMIFESTKSLANIAQETGFVDNSHFTRAYKRRFSVSPSEDRKLRRKETDGH